MLVRDPAFRAFSYALLRVVRVERGERLNVGVVLFCRQCDYLQVREHVNAQRLAALATGLDPELVRSRLLALRRVAAGNADGGAVAALPPSERFGWIVAPSSTIIQPSQAHTGLTVDPAATLERLFRKLVA